MEEIVCGGASRALVFGLPGPLTRAETRWITAPEFFIFQTVREERRTTPSIANEGAKQEKLHAPTAYMAMLLGAV